MMRFLVALFIVIGLISPLYAVQTELLYEDFEGATPGTMVNTLGWIGPDTMVISETLVDQGQSAGYTGTATDWPIMSKMFDYSPSETDQYVLTGTLWAAGTLHNYAHIQLKDSTGAGQNKRLHAALGYNELIFGYILDDGNYSDDARVPMLLTPMDVKMVVSGKSFDAYWKENGTSEWIYIANVDSRMIGGVESNPGVDISDFDYVQLIGHGGYDGGIDTVRLTVISESFPGDANLDGRVDVDDAIILAANWLASGTTWHMGDFNEDGTVDDEDATILAVNWQHGVAQAAVPEPGTIVLLFLGGLPLLLTVRKRFA